MIKFPAILTYLGAAGAIGVLSLSTTLVAQGPTPLPSVWLQSSTPGSPQIGSVNITGGLPNSGTLIANRVGIGISTPASQLDVVTTSSPYAIHAQNSSSIAIFGESAGASSAGVYGKSNITGGFGVSGEGSTGIIGAGYENGVIGRTIDTSAVCFGVRGESSSLNGKGVIGLATSTTGSPIAIYGESTSATSSAISGKGGVIGVFGHAQTSNVTTSGVSGRSDSTAGRGVFGHATASTGTTIGGSFRADSSSGTGVFGWSTSTAPTSTIYGVYGRASVDAQGYAVYAEGDMGASGLKPFRIDHPNDPANKYLLHYASESPEVINFYSGKVMLDEGGEAVVTMPSYFASINKDPRYTITPVGCPMPNLHVAEEINEDALTIGESAEAGIKPPSCWFRIRGGVPNGKVSWRVEAVRNDLRVRLHGAPVEQAKIGHERGRYQHPEFYGLPNYMGLRGEAMQKKQGPPQVRK